MRVVCWCCCVLFVVVGVVDGFPLLFCRCLERVVCCRLLVWCFFTFYRCSCVLSLFVFVVWRTLCAGVFGCFVCVIGCCCCLFVVVVVCLIVVCCLLFVIVGCCGRLVVVVCNCGGLMLLWFVVVSC